MEDKVEVLRRGTWRSSEGARRRVGLAWCCSGLGGSSRSSKKPKGDQEGQAMDELRATLEDPDWFQKFLETPAFYEAPPQGHGTTSEGDGLSLLELEDRYWVQKFSKTPAFYEAPLLATEFLETPAFYEAPPQGHGTTSDGDGLSLLELEDRYWVQKFSKTPVFYEAPPLITEFLETPAFYEAPLQGHGTTSEGDGLSLLELEDRYWVQKFSKTLAFYEAPSLATEFLGTPAFYEAGSGEMEF